MKPEVPVFLIVTPAFNSAALIDETIMSVVSQAGSFRIRYHVQDGCSTDDTSAKLERWASIFSSGSFPVLCSGVEFSFRSEKDGGMYDAINRGFDHLNRAGAEYMTYVNSDDRLLPGALQFAASVFRDLSEIAWLGGRPCEMNESGESMRIHPEQVYPTATLQAGLHGRMLRFVMQEGTFWRAELWNRAGGFRTSLRQAGDWDLWRRFAAEASYVTTDVCLAAHRRRDAQLTANMADYHREMDEVINRECPDLYHAESERFRTWASYSAGDRDRRFYGRMVRFHETGHGGRGEWKVEDRPYQAILKTPIVVTNGFTCAMLPADFETGFGPACDADYSLNLLAGFRVTNSAKCSFRFEARRDGLHRLFLRCRTYDPGVRLRLLNETRTIFHAELPCTSLDRDCVVIAESIFITGTNVVSMTLLGQDPQKVPVLVLVSCEAMSTI